MRGSRMRERRRQRIDRRVDAQLRNRARQVRRRVEVRERRRRRRVGVVVGRHVDRLHRRDRALLRRRDALLHLAHLAEQRRLVADRRRHAAEQRRHFRAGLREAEDVVDEEQHVLAFARRGSTRRRSAPTGRRAGARPAAPSSVRRPAPRATCSGRAMSMTPLSWNSCQRSLPSRVRSPTPPNTDTPPCFRAMLWISSMMTTVLPTPAPPNRPILPPCRYGSSRSMTLMPVSNIFSSVDWSSSVGAAR